MLENLRFDAREKAGDPTLARELARVDRHRGGSESFDLAIDLRVARSARSDLVAIG